MLQRTTERVPKLCVVTTNKETTDWAETPTARYKRTRATRQWGKVTKGAFLGGHVASYHLGATIPNWVSLSPIVYFGPTMTRYSQLSANKQPPAGLWPCRMTQNNHANDIMYLCIM
jgi:hypothetical protein